MDNGDHFRIEVFGVQQGQAINNQFDYLVDSGTVTTTEVLTAWRAIWRATVLAGLSDTYSVNNYQIKRLAGIYPESNANGAIPFPNFPPVAITPAPRWDEAAGLVGSQPSDTGDATTDPMPSYAAANFKKVCGAWEEPDNITALPLEKKPRGSFRLPGLLEADTEPADGNVFTSGAQTYLAAVATALRTFTSASGAYTMCVLSFVKDKFYRSERVVVGDDDHWEATYAVAVVNSLLASPYVSTQVSRKQSVSRLG